MNTDPVDLDEIVAAKVKDPVTMSELSAAWLKHELTESKRSTISLTAVTEETMKTAVQHGYVLLGVHRIATQASLNDWTRCLRSSPSFAICRRSMWTR